MKIVLFIFLSYLGKNGLLIEENYLDNLFPIYYYMHANMSLCLVYIIRIRCCTWYEIGLPIPLTKIFVVSILLKRKMHVHVT